MGLWTLYPPPVMKSKICGVRFRATRQQYAMACQLPAGHQSPHGLNPEDPDLAEKGMCCERLDNRTCILALGHAGDHVLGVCEDEYHPITFFPDGNVIDPGSFRKRLRTQVNSCID